MSDRIPDHKVYERNGIILFLEKKRELGMFIVYNYTCEANV